MLEKIKEFLYRLRGLAAFCQVQNAAKDVAGFMDFSACKALFFLLNPHRAQAI